MSGESMLITENQNDAIQRAILNGDELIPVNGTLINVKAIAKVGTHQSTSEIKKINQADIDLKLNIAGKYKLVDERRKNTMKKSIESAKNGNSEFDKLIDGEPEALKKYLNEPDKPAEVMSSEEDANGDKMYYLNESGEKCYS